MGGNIPIDTTITLEFLPHNRRFLLAALSIFQPIGVVVCSAIAFGFIPTMSCSPNFSEANPLPSCNTSAAGEACCGRSNNMGWRYLLFTLGGITLAVFFVRFVVFNFRESPKFLIYNGQDEEAVRVVQHIAKTNRRVCHLRIEDFEALSSGSGGSDSGDRTEMLDSGGRISTFKRVRRMRPSRTKLHSGLERYGLLFSSFTMARLTILVWLTYIMDFWGFTVAGEIIRLWLLPAKAQELTIPPQAFTSRASSLSRMAPLPNPSPSPTAPTSIHTPPASSASSSAQPSTGFHTSAANGP